ncbi:uncharacterized protein [Manis javanica]|uniref:uncharacterized protein isoform X1 n=1 Tax=Manis javanica TaxID=9974 RepID=UPI003C6CF000
MVHLSTTLPVIAGLACRQVLDGRACRTGAWPRSRRPAGTVHATGGSPPGSVVALPGTPSLSNEDQQNPFWVPERLIRRVETPGAEVQDDRTAFAPAVDPTAGDGRAELQLQPSPFLRQRC